MLLGIAPADDTENEMIDLYVAAINPLVRGLAVCDKANTDPAPDDWSGADLGDIVLGANMLCARVYRRKDSPAGLAAMGAGAPVYIERNDPDVAQLLQIGSYSGASVG